MRSSSFVALAAAIVATAALAAPSNAAVQPAGLSLRSPGAHRRHHHPSSGHKRKRQTCKASSSSSSPSASSSGSSTTNGSSSSSNSTSSATSVGAKVNLSSGFLNKNGLHWGYLPDEADAGGSKQSMSEINSWTNSKSAFYGYYAQAQSGKTFDGSQLLAVIDDVKASGAIFQPAVMPTGGWQGLTASDNSQAINIANVMKQFTDQGIEVWLRFAHEVNWYQTDGTYSGGVSDFQAGWKAVSDAMDQIAPDVKMFFTPNIASEEEYDTYYPQGGRVDVIGIDYYPSQSGTFVSRMKSFHDKYTNDNVKFAIGETGWGQSADISTRLAYVQEITSDETLSALPNFVGATWFNFMKGYDFRIVTGDDSTTSSTVSFFAS